MKGLVAVVLSYGCLAIVAALLFTSRTYAAPTNRGVSMEEPVLRAEVATDGNRPLRCNTHFVSQSGRSSGAGASCSLDPIRRRSVPPLRQ